MFETLSDRLCGIFDKLTRRGALTESDVAEAMREVRRALIEADVALDVVRDFTDAVAEKAVGQEVVRSITPGQMVVKIVHDELVRMLGAEAEPIDLAATPPVAIMMVGPAGLRQDHDHRQDREAPAEPRQEESADGLARHAAARRAGAAQGAGRAGGHRHVAHHQGQDPAAITRRALQAARLGGYDVVMLDTAGRLHIDDELMRETEEVRDIAKPHETLLVADSLTGQDAVNLARTFNERMPLTGIVLTRIDGDGRGGAALSMRAVTGKPIKLLGTGEKLEASRISTQSASQAASSAWATWSALSRRPPRRSRSKRPRRWRQEAAKGRSTSRTWPSSSSRCRRSAACRRARLPARHRQDQEADRRRQSRRQDLQAPAAIISSMTPRSAGTRSCSSRASGVSRRAPAHACRTSTSF